jgi:Ca2+-binding EF-hand superfamily protein
MTGDLYPSYDISRRNITSLLKLISSSFSKEYGMDLACGSHEQISRVCINSRRNIMVNGIGSYNSYQNYLQPQAMRTPHDPAEMFKKVDTDGSGGISQSELDAMAEGMSSRTGQTIDTSTALSTYDTDGNGELSSEEMEAFMKSTMQQGVGHPGMHGGPGGPGDLSKALDTDGSGGVSQAELEEWAKDMTEETGNTLNTTDAVSTYDIDGDGELSSSELSSFLDASGISGPGMAGMAPPPPPPAESPDTDSSTSSSVSGVMSKYDTNGDGVLSASELQAYLDDQSKSSGNNLFAKALSAYSGSVGNNGEFNIEELFMNFAGGSYSDYSPIDFSI